MLDVKVGLLRCICPDAMLGFGCKSFASKSCRSPSEAVGFCNASAADASSAALESDALGLARAA